MSHDSHGQCTFHLTFFIEHLTSNSEFLTIFFIVVKVEGDYHENVDGPQITTLGRVEGGIHTKGKQCKNYVCLALDQFFTAANIKDLEGRK